MMNLRPIRNEEDYETALEEIEALWEAESGTPEADRLDILVMLVEAYEAGHYPIPDPDPIELILHVMEARGLTRRAAINERRMLRAGEEILRSAFARHRDAQVAPLLEQLCARTISRSGRYGTRLPNETHRPSRTAGGSVPSRSPRANS